jgi:hypothetical protein
VKEVGCLNEAPALGAKNVDYRCGGPDEWFVSQRSLLIHRRTDEIADPRELGFRERTYALYLEPGCLDKKDMLVKASLASSFDAELDYTTICDAQLSSFRSEHPCTEDGASISRSNLSRFTEWQKVALTYPKQAADLQELCILMLVPWRDFEPAK